MVFQLDLSKTTDLFHKICKTKNHVYTYGTAGFRDKAAILDTVMFTTGFVACLRSLSHDGKAVGVMVTASHNPPVDNGVKIVEPNGSMLSQDWEPIATDLANLASQGKIDELVQFVNAKLIELNSNKVPTLIVGRDSRESSTSLLECLKEGSLKLFDAKIVDYELLTTPQLHFLTNAYNLEKDLPKETDYYHHFNNAWDQLISINNDASSSTSNKIESLIIDSANGIGGPKMENLLKYWKTNYKVRLINNNWKRPESLNNNCGADYVKTNQKLPNGITTDIINESSKNVIHCSFDGDADRVVFYYQDPQSNTFNLLDGDKISTLFANFISMQLKLAGIDYENEIKLGVVQTAYANGSSTNYLQQNLKIPVACAKTGVKHLHHEACTRYDIGVYFEANGHGTIIFSENFYKIINQKINAESQIENTPKLRALKTLKVLSALINQTVGDAISDMMGVMAVLAILNWTPQIWNKEYTDLPNKLAKLVVPDRSVFETTDQERKLTSPAGLQSKINKIVAKYENGRSFVRASGTEDAVRVYAEASDDVNKLCQEVLDATAESVN
ncbi:hypothetical protein TBLA_0G00980 [Henningerozyma blattae CBS 6284]|uniref:Phosphoacetylglucosamine mutase n=1 Tax=Henningerozyma blattae (strain ATCC 34711 / CBS 6284 / DSM 70876 / NBRC 10599 / NRRL Y-10934 / UCD 77-7) TaxID=1071380 RepID=I2H6P3_HENB6|nr:hypothetical protein TBLA_0G00980 [Tetrapisispora blattae CBS 6284]CCH62045.1 hypothetical protein TBLA_0G00980 [Tetrapisispora blattae CBS 6284]